jgi:undecaprenyl-diphosphatase
VDDSLQLWEAVLLGLVEGLTEFLPVSSTGHLTIIEKMMGLSIDDPDVTAFTAIIQVGAVLATLIFFRRDWNRLVRGLLAGLRDPERRSERDYRFGIAVILGSIPIGIVGLTFKDEIETTLRNLWVVASALILWSFVMLYADRRARQDRHEDDVTWRDTLIVGIAQCLALIPGISRSGATMSAGLLRGLDRVTVTRLSFFLSVPALTAACVLQVITRYDDISAGVGWAPTLLATFVSFVVAYVAVAWLLRFIARHTYTIFIVYRLIIGTAVLVALGTGALAPT